MVTIVRRGPSMATGHTLRARGTYIRPHFLPCTEAQLKVSGTRTRGGVHSLWKTPWRMGGSWCALERNLPAPSPTPHIHYSSWWQRDSAGPLAFLHWLFLQHGDRHMGLLKAPRSQQSASMVGSSQREALPFLVPSLQPFSGQNREDGPDGEWALTRAHWSDLLAQEVLHTLRKSKRMKWDDARKNQLFKNSYTWNRSTKIMMMFLLLRTMYVFPFLVLGVEDPVSTILEVKPKGGVCVSVSVWVSVNSGIDEDEVYMAVPYSSYH